MPSHKYLLIIALAASIVTPVLSAEAAQPLYDNSSWANLSVPDMFNSFSGKNEKRATSTSNPEHATPVEGGRLGNKLDLGLKGLVLTGVVALIAGSLYLNLRPKKQKDDTTDTIQSTNATQPASTGQTNPPRAIARRKERFLDRDLPVDVSGEPRSKSRPERRGLCRY